MPSRDWRQNLVCGGEIRKWSESIYQFSSVAQSCLTLCDPVDCSTPGVPVHHQLPELAQTHVHQLSDAIQPSRPLLSPSRPAFNLSQHQVFSNELILLIRWPKYWRFRFSISPSNEYSGVISFRIHWFDLLEVWGTFQSLIQHHRSKASILQCLAFLYSNTHFHMTVGKTIPLTWQTFAGKVMSLLFNMLSRLEQQTRWKLAKEEVKAVYCPPAYLTYM